MLHVPWLGTCHSYNDYNTIDSCGPFLLTWINFNPSMDK